MKVAHFNAIGRSIVLPGLGCDVVIRCVNLHAIIALLRCGITQVRVDVAVELTGLGVAVAHVAHDTGEQPAGGVSVRGASESLFILNGVRVCIKTPESDVYAGTVHRHGICTLRAFFLVTAQPARLKGASGASGNSFLPTPKKVCNFFFLEIAKIAYF